jgi:hypothetical protein
MTRVLLFLFYGPPARPWRDAGGGLTLLLHVLLYARRLAAARATRTDCAAGMIIGDRCRI